MASSTFSTSRVLAAAVTALLFTGVGVVGALPAAATGCAAASFGAGPDDVADDTAALQSALDAGCGVVTIDEGTYLLSGALAVSDNSGIQGPGTLRQTADTDTVLNADPAGGNVNITLDGFAIQKDFVNNSLADGVRLDNTSGAVVTGLEITGISARSGIELVRCDDFEVSHNHLHGFSADSGGVLPDGDPVSIDSIYIRLSSNGVVTDNRIEDMDGGPNLQSDGIFVTSDDVIVERNYIKNVGEGIDLGAAENVTVRKNIIIEIGAFGIKAGNGSRNNTITLNYVERAQLSGITIFNGASTINGNGPTENNVVSYNTIRNAGWQDRSTHPIPFIPTAGIAINGYLSTWAPVTGTVVKNNVIIDTYSPHRMENGLWEDLNTADNTFSGNIIVGWTKNKFRDDTTSWCTDSTCEEY